MAYLDEKGLQTLISKIKSQVYNSVMPVGAVYTQYPSQLPPSELFGGTWTDITSAYSGLFFKAENDEDICKVTNLKADKFSYSESASSGIYGLYIGLKVRKAGFTSSSEAINYLKKTYKYVISNDIKSKILSWGREDAETFTDYFYFPYIEIRFALPLPKIYLSKFQIFSLSQTEGLPNIKGKMKGATGDYSEAFKITSNQVGSYGGTSTKFYEVDFDASKGETKMDGTIQNDVYGNSDHVTPANALIKIWKRTA